MQKNIWWLHHTQKKVVVMHQSENSAANPKGFQKFPSRLQSIRSPTLLVKRVTLWALKKVLLRTYKVSAKKML